MIWTRFTPNGPAPTCQGYGYADKDVVNEEGDNGSDQYRCNCITQHTLKQSVSIPEHFSISNAHSPNSGRMRLSHPTVSS